MPTLTATLIIDLMSSRCSNCGKNTLPAATHHTRVSGYGGGRPGCGAEFVDTAPGHVGISDEVLHRMRPDLPIHGKND
ncbi:hypothetical protein [Streptomyces sp. NPDC091215]|uniref:hypothetical protein n=1 Tax=Streptomyces sp. NPDC091215 TaxID=3155192 RepID=UPI0034293C8E